MEKSDLAKIIIKQIEDLNPNDLRPFKILLNPN